MNDSLLLYTNWMRLALLEAKMALHENEVPVGAVFVKHRITKHRLNDKIRTLTKENIPELLDLQHGEIIARGHNQTNKTRDATSHAEFIALEEILRRKLNTQDDEILVLYVTCEPCVMCTYALILAGIKIVVFGCSNERFGGCGSTLDVHQIDKGLTCVSGILKDEAVAILKKFYDGENPHAPLPKRKKQIDNKASDAV
jgi:tRNA-specific adenosine deaminase 2